MTLGNQSSSQLQMGANRKGDPPSPKGDEDPLWDWEDPLQLLEQLACTQSNDIYHPKSYLP